MSIAVEKKSPTLQGAKSSEAESARGDGPARRSQLAIAAKSFITFATLQLLLPVTGTLLVVAILRKWVLRRPDRYASHPANAPGGEARTVAALAGKTVLISGGKMTKALQLARSMKQAGLRVLLCETPQYSITAHRFSRCVDRFITTPLPTEDDYVDELVKLIQREAIDFYIPVCSPVASIRDSQARTRLDSICEVIHPSPETIEMLDDKFQLARAAQAIGLGACESHRITDANQVIEFDFAKKNRTFIIKSIAYDSVRRLDLTPLPRSTCSETETFVRQLPISEESPWVLQEFVPGREFCTHSTARNGKLCLHVCCESSPFQVNYDPVDEPEIEAWVRQFISHYQLDGQISFDFMRADDDGRLYVIECNPRTHSAITAFHDHPNVAEAFLGSGDANSMNDIETLRPLPDSKPTYWMVHELWRALKSLHRPLALLKRARVIFHGKDAVFDWDDPLPFLMLHHYHVPVLLLRDVWQRRGWVRIDFNIGKLVQAGGD